MESRIPQSVAKLVVFKAFLASDHVTAATGKTIVMQVSQNGGAFANFDGGALNATEIASGWYKAQLQTADTDTKGPLIVRGTEGTIDPAEVVYHVVNATNADFTALPAVIAGAALGVPLKDANSFLAVANMPAVAAGGTNGLFIAGTNAATTITTSLTTGAITLTTPIESDMTYIHGTALTETAGQLAGSFIKFFDVAAPTATALSLPDAVPGASTGVLISGSNTGTTTLGALTVTGATTLTGAVSLGSTLGITGAVTLSSTLNTGAATFASAAITGALTTGSISNSGTTTLTGNVSLPGTTTISYLDITNDVLISGNFGIAGTCNVLGTTTFTGAVSMTAGLAANITGNLIGTVSTVTTNSDMRGTDSANTVVPPSVSQFNARTIVSADYVVVGDTIARVTLVDTVTTVTGGATEAKQNTAQTDLDTLTDASGEPGQGAPPASATMIQKVGYMYKMWRNKKTQTATEKKLYADNGTTVDQKSTVSDDATTFTDGEMGTGA